MRKIFALALLALALAGGAPVVRLIVAGTMITVAMAGVLARAKPAIARGSGSTKRPHLE